MGDQLDDLVLLDAIVDGADPVAAQLLGAVQRHQGGDSDQAAVALGQARALPDIAEQLRLDGRSIIDAATEAARIRLRPILMTSFAFILGVLPLAVATGPGSAARNSVGTAVAGGMLASTFLSIVFIPVLYVVIRTLVPGKARRHRDELEDASHA